MFHAFQVSIPLWFSLNDDLAKQLKMLQNSFHPTMVLAQLGGRN